MPLCFIAILRSPAASCLLSSIKHYLTKVFLIVKSSNATFKGIIQLSVPDGDGNEVKEEINAREMQIISLNQMN